MSRQRVHVRAGVTHRLSFPPDLVLYCEAFLTTYRTFITPEELIKKLQYRYPFLAPVRPQSLPHWRKRGVLARSALLQGPGGRGGSRGQVWPGSAVPWCWGLRRGFPLELPSPSVRGLSKGRGGPRTGASCLGAAAAPGGPESLESTCQGGTMGAPAASSRAPGHWGGGRDVRDFRNRGSGEQPQGRHGPSA